MCAFVKSVIGPVIGGVISASVGLAMFLIQRRLSAKDDFIGIIDDLRAKLHVSGEQEHVFYSESLEMLRQCIKSGVICRASDEFTCMRFYEVTRT